jgi:two-component system sensor histidine kinase UhpB
VECIRRLSHDLHPTVLQYLGLAAALCNYCQECADLSSHRISFQADGPADGIPPATALCVYRVAQEAVQNSIKHAQVDAVEVLLTRFPGGVSLVVSDRGVGLRQGARGGLGLVSMKERARLVNGTVDVSGELGSGVTVTLKVPIPAPAA